MKYTQNYIINSHETDFNGVVRPSVVLRYMQETGNLQFHTNHPNLYELNEMGMSFLLSRVSFVCYKPLYKFDKIKVDSWACDGKGVAYIRCSQIYRGDELIAELNSTWALLDRESHKFVRHGEIEFQFGTDDPIDVNGSNRARIPRDLELSEVGTRTTYYGDVDLYGHMNNTNYPDMLCAFIPDMKGKMVKECSINFINEAPLGHTVKITMANVDDVYYFRTIKEDDTVGVEAEIKLTNI